MNRMDNVLSEVAQEVNRAITFHSPMASPHESYAVILEELDEYWTEVKRKDFDGEAARKELIQVAAMAVRALLELF